MLFQKRCLKNTKIIEYKFLIKIKLLGFPERKSSSKFYIYKKRLILEKYNLLKICLINKKVFSSKTIFVIFTLCWIYLNSINTKVSKLITVVTVLDIPIVFTIYAFSLQKQVFFSNKFTLCFN